jgi:hypothetical protein
MKQHNTMHGTKQHNEATALGRTVWQRTATNWLAGSIELLIEVTGTLNFILGESLIMLRIGTGGGLL